MVPGAWYHIWYGLYHIWHHIWYQRYGTIYGTRNGTIYGTRGMWHVVLQQSTPPLSVCQQGRAPQPPPSEGLGFLRLEWWSGKEWREMPGRCPRAGHFF